MTPEIYITADFTPDGVKYYRVVANGLESARLSTLAEAEEVLCRVLNAGKPSASPTPVSMRRTHE